MLQSKIPIHHKHIPKASYFIVCLDKILPKGHSQFHKLMWFWSAQHYLFVLFINYSNEIKNSKAIINKAVKSQIWICIIVAIIKENIELLQYLQDNLHHHSRLITSCIYFGYYHHPIFFSFVQIQRVRGEGCHLYTNSFQCLWASVWCRWGFECTVMVKFTMLNQSTKFTSFS